MVNFMELIKSFLVAPYFLGMILGGVFLGIYVLIDKIIKNPIKDHYLSLIEHFVSDIPQKCPIVFNKVFDKQ